LSSSNFRNGDISAAQKRPRGDVTSPKCEIGFPKAESRSRFGHGFEFALQRGSHGRQVFWLVTSGP
jgi:hypothetical protein